MGECELMIWLARSIMIWYWKPQLWLTTMLYANAGLPTRIPPVPTEQAFQAMRAAVESGCNFWNAGEFYGTPDWNTQTLLAAYFKRYPEDAEKVVLSVKGAFDIATFKPDGTPEGIKRSLDKILKDLDGTKKVDIFECARVDPNTPLEVTLKYLEEEYVNKGIIGGIALSEVNAESIRRAVKVTKIVAVEIELSLWATHVLENGVATTCAELDIPLIA
jgi:pyridoxine 4-dehydrogenase